MNLTQEDDDETAIHWRGQADADCHGRYPSAYTACRKVYAEVNKGLLWIRRLVTDNERLVTCERCQGSDDWCRIARLSGYEPEGWVAGGATITAGDDIVAIVTNSASVSAGELVKFPEMKRALMQLLSGDVKGARAEASRILADMPERRPFAELRGGK